MELTQQQLARAVAAQLASEGARQVRLSANKTHPLWTALPAAGVATSDEASTHVVVVAQVAEDGGAGFSGAPPDGGAGFSGAPPDGGAGFSGAPPDGGAAVMSSSTEVVAVLDELSEQPPGLVRAAAKATTKARRVFTRLGVLEVRDEGLVIVALAPGVSATDLQRFSVPTLKLTAAVKEMVQDEGP